MILSTADPNQVISIRSIFPVLRIQVSNAHTEFNRQMPSQWTHVSISYSCSCVILPPVSLLLFQLKIIGTSFGICSQEVSGQSSARMAVSQPVTRLCPSRKELIAEITSAVRPPRAFVLNIQRPPLSQWQLHFYVRSQGQVVKQIIFNASTVLQVWLWDSTDLFCPITCPDIMQKRK